MCQCGELERPREDGQGTNISARDFSTFCANAIAAIGHLTDTVYVTDDARHATTGGTSAEIAASRSDPLLALTVRRPAELRYGGGGMC